MNGPGNNGYGFLGDGVTGRTGDPDPGPDRHVMTVRVTLSIDVDLVDYRNAYGDDDVATIRRDVKYAVLGAVSSGGVLADGIVDARLAGGDA